MFKHGPLSDRSLNNDFHTTSEGGKDITPTRSPEYLAGVVTQLWCLARETEWVEFKHNNDSPQDIGEYISALANGAALNDKQYAYVLWGIHDQTHAIVGHHFLTVHCQGRQRAAGELVAQEVEPTS